jgi:probable phosphoglycerate mutase
MKLLLARHGNTFESGDTPFIVGRNEDLPLTLEGEAQATRLARYLHTENLVPDTIRCGPLERTRRSAAIVADMLALKAPKIDTRLTELDYGDWSGLTTDEVRTMYGREAIDAWDHHGIMPDDRGWSPSPEDLLADVQDFAADALEIKGTLLAVTSNGVLRFFAKLVDGLFDELASARALKVGTGNVCCLEHDGVRWQLGFWNERP